MERLMRRWDGVLLVAVMLMACARSNPLFGYGESAAGEHDGERTTGEAVGAPKGDGQVSTTDGGRGMGHGRTDDPGPPPDMGSGGPMPDINDTGAETDGAQLDLCCERSDEPGCQDAALETCVCDIDDFCCLTSWDTFCVEAAIEDCGAVCENEVTCCAPSVAMGCADDVIEACVCNQQPQCCTGAYDISCVTIADACTGGCFTGDNDCCAATLEHAGCNEAAVWTCVCPLDAYCCSGTWDALCVSRATEQCGLCEPPASTDSCCVESPPGGCADQFGGAGVQNCVCDLDPTCCTGSWSQACIDLGIDQCNLFCE